MDDVAFYEFMLKLNTFLNRLSFLSGKMIKQEELLRDAVIKTRTVLSPDLFNELFQPIADIIESRITTMVEMSESGEEMFQQIKELHDNFKGIIQ